MYCSFLHSASVAFSFWKDPPPPFLSFPFPNKKYESTNSIFFLRFLLLHRALIWMIECGWLATEARSWDSSSLVWPTHSATLVPDSLRLTQLRLNNKWWIGNSSKTNTFLGMSATLSLSLLEEYLIKQMDQSLKTQSSLAPSVCKSLATRFEFHHSFGCTTLLTSCSYKVKLSWTLRRWL